jgi:hypothetical protein
MLTQSLVSAILPSLLLKLSSLFVCLFTPILTLILQVAIFVSKENDFEVPISTDSKSALYKLYLNIHRNCIVSVYSNNNSSSGRRHGNVNRNEEEDMEDSTSFGNGVDTVDYQYGEHGGSKSEIDGIEKFKRNYESSFNDVVMYEGKNQIIENKETLGDRGKSDNETKKMKNNNCADNDSANSRVDVNGSRSNMGGCVGEGYNGSGCKYGSSSEDSRHDMDRAYSAHDMMHRMESQQNSIQNNSVGTVNDGYGQNDNMSDSRHSDRHHSNSSSHSEENFGSRSDLIKREMLNRNFDSNILNNINIHNNTNGDRRNDNYDNNHNFYTSSGSSGNNDNNSYSKSYIGNGDCDLQYSHSNTQSSSSSSRHRNADHNNNANNNNISNDNNRNSSSNSDDNGSIKCEENIFYNNYSNVHENQNQNRHIDRRNDKNNIGNGGPQFNDNNAQNNGNADFPSRNDKYNVTVHSNNTTGDRSTILNENYNGNRSESVNQHALRGVPSDNYDNNIQLLNISNNNSKNNNNNGVMRNGNNGLGYSNSSSSSRSGSTSSHVAQQSQTAQFTAGNNSRNNIKVTFFDTVKSTDLSVTEAALHRKDNPNSSSHGDGHGYGGKGISYCNTYSGTDKNMNINANMNMSVKQTFISSSQGEKGRFNYDNSGNRVAKQRIHDPGVDVDKGTAATDSALVHCASTSTGAAYSQKEENSNFFSNRDNFDINSVDTARKRTQIGSIQYGKGNYESTQNNSAFFETSTGTAKPAGALMLLSTENAQSNLGAKKKKERSAD